jgi:hypothetical protein
MDLPRHAAPRGRTFLGKPLGWTRGWTVVVLVWAVAAALLVAARVEVGHVTALSAREAAAIGAVEASKVPAGGVGGEAGGAEGELTTAEALQLVLQKYGATATTEGGAARPQWYAMDRPWEDRVYVYWELGDYEPLAWLVDDDGTVTPDAETTVLLTGLARLEGQGGL